MDDFALIRLLFENLIFMLFLSSYILFLLKMQFLSCSIYHLLKWFHNFSLPNNHWSLPLNLRRLKIRSEISPFRQFTPTSYTDLYYYPNCWSTKSFQTHIALIQIHTRRLLLDRLSLCIPVFLLFYSRSGGVEVPTISHDQSFQPPRVSD